MPENPTQPHIVVLNQHGDNRGDEAAMLAMVRGFGDRLPGARFTVFHQFADPSTAAELPCEHTYLPIRLSVVEYVRLGIFAALLLVRVRARSVLSPTGQAMVDAIDEADLVVSAPGGPYFGDLYAGHEAAHWLYVWLAHRSGAPLGLYAPSCGPFEHRLLNPLRRRGFRWFDRVVLRESRSAWWLEQLTGIRAEVTIDAAMQELVPPADRTDWAKDDEFLLVVAVRDPDGAATIRHDAAVVAAVQSVVDRGPTSVVFVPQLHGAVHQDAPYLSGLAERISGAASVQVAPPTTDSRAQRALVAAADLVIGGRYHPAVFSISAATPVVVIPYEHKSMGVAETAGIADCTMWVDDLTVEGLVSLTEDVLARREEIRATLRSASSRLQALSARTTELMVELVA